jgi:MFS transporter, SP family, major inositol transporter
MVVPLYIGKIVPPRVRGGLVSLNQLAIVAVLGLLSAIGGVGAFFLFGFLTLVALAYFWRKVPETKGRSLQEIERDLVPDRS